MSNWRYSLKIRPSCWNCARLRKSKRVINEFEDGKGYEMSAPSWMDALAGYQCDHFWWGDKPDSEFMLCGGREWKEKIARKYKKKN